MKKIVSLIIAIALIASMGIVASFASFETEGYDEIEFDAETGTGKYNVTKYGTVYDDAAQKIWFYGEGEEYLYQLVELKEYAQTLQIGAGIGEGFSGKLNIALYNCSESLYDSVEGTPVASGVAKVFFSSWRTGIVFDEVVAPGTYVLELTVPEDTDEFWVAVSAFAEGMAPETVDIDHSGLAGGAEFGTGLVGISFRTYLERDFVAPDNSGDPATEVPATEAPATEAPATEAATAGATEEAPATEDAEPTDAATEEAKATDVPAEESKDDTSAEEKSGCGSVIAGGAAVSLVMAAAVVFLKKRK